MHCGVHRGAVHCAVPRGAVHCAVPRGAVLMVLFTVLFARMLLIVVQVTANISK